MSEQRRILIIDDNQEIVRGISIRLRAAGYAVLTANDGQSGLDVAIAERPDAIILDLRMPVLDGMGFLDEARKRIEPPRIPVIVLSANVVEKARRRAMELGATSFLEKPYDAKRLMRALEYALESSADPNAAPAEPTPSA